MATARTMIRSLLLLPFILQLWEVSARIGSNSTMTVAADTIANANQPIVIMEDNNKDGGSFEDNIEAYTEAKYMKDPLQSVLGAVLKDTLDSYTGQHGQQQRKLQNKDKDKTKNITVTTESQAGNQEIVGGSPATPGEFPWFVAFDPLVICGGSLIAPNMVLTAAHCVQDRFGNVRGPSAVKVGASTLSDGELISVCDVVVHPNYSDNGDGPINDVAVLKLSTSSTVTPVTLNQKTAYPPVAGGTALQVIGFGATSEGGDTSDVLKKLTTSSVSIEACQTYYPEVSSDFHVCADVTGEGDCQGDSGGPLFDISNVQVGVVSYGFGCARDPSQDVYANVAQYYNWIQEQVNLDCAPTPAPTPFPTMACPSGESLFQFEILTDEYPFETSWTLKNDCDGTSVASGGGSYASATRYQESACINTAENSYTFTIEDTASDGICCGFGEGSYTIYLDGAIQSTGGNFGSVDTLVSFVGTCSAPTAPTIAPTVAPTPVTAATPYPSVAPPEPCFLDNLLDAIFP